jgi:hypothetical protein
MVFLGCVLRKREETNPELKPELVEKTEDRWSTDIL